jgi:nucleoside-diphosphate-sugar epimerase
LIAKIFPVFFECYGLNTTVLRIFNNYGPRAHYEGDSGEIIPRTIVNLLNGINPVIFGDGSNTRDFFFVKDTARVLASLIGNNKIKGKTFNLGTGVEISMKSLVEEIISLIPDNKIDVVLGKPGFSKVEDEGQKILQLLRENNGYLPYNDKSDPTDIYDFCGMSKKAFKMTTGNLYKQKLISFTQTGIQLIES